jgi:hypothetical protein
LRIRDVYPGSRILIFTHLGSRISDPKTGTKERGEKKFVEIPFFVPQISQNCKLFNFCNVEEKNLGQFSKNYRTFYPKNSQKYGFGILDPRSGKTYSGSRGQKGTRSRIRIRNTGQRYGSGSFYHKAKIVRKNFIATFL